MVNADFWRSKRVLVTGHTGFKGAWLSKWLQSMEAQVAGLALKPSTRPNAFNVMRCKLHAQSVIGDIRDYRLVRKIIAAFKPEVIFHLAAQSLVREGYADPLTTYSTNVMGTINILQAARDVDSVRAIVNVTSDKCYENRNWLWGYRESDALGGSDPYSSSKACAEIATTAFVRSYFANEESEPRALAVATARAGNVIGGGDWATDRLIPDLVRGATQNKPVLIRNPDAIRPWQHVLEPLAGYLMLGEALINRGRIFVGPWNFGPAENGERPVSWIANSFSATWGKGASWIVDDQAHPREARLLKLDSTKARDLLQWQPRWSVESALKATVAWYKAYYARSEMDRATIRQINSYMKLVSEVV